ncbi:MAG: arsenate reductase [Alphaproteobacteria bacterium]|nr:arsenate reductase [Alphaproteobacteria bacterium]MBU0798994.1 arsenate reductase [Alphaproteobacteria bacterium]MBU0887737.1 arsenate reductase [Alphaproteobacteria bacterium]MBU1815040.1 arsenate reductase [Alphaproteobacteria bacterium]
MITLYGIPNCGTVKKARVWLEEQGIAYSFHDFKKQGLDADTAKRWAKELGTEKLVNRKGTTWRKLDAATQAILQGANPVPAILENLSVIKRPVIDLGDRRLVGFGPEEIAVLESRQAS